MQIVGGGGMETEKRGRESMWGRVALQSLAEIAVTHCYTHTGTYTHTLGSAVAFRGPG